jgi:hypothetical protein
MKKLLLFCFVGLIGLTLALAADDLGELAKKEKAKREALQKQGKTPKVLTNEDLERMNSNEQTKTGDVEKETAEEAQGESQASEGETESGSTNESSGISGSPDVVAGSELAAEEAPKPSIDEQLRQLQAQKEEAQAKEKQAQEAIDNGGLFHTYAVGNQFRQEREAGDSTEEINKKIQQLEQQKKEQEAVASQPMQNPQEQEQATEQEQPTDLDQPSEGEQPANVEQPTEGEQPAEKDQPAEGETAEPPNN